jgi:hypothetical protein
MKITFIIQDLFFRGAQYATAMIANGFAAKGYDVDVLVSKIHSEYQRKATNAYFFIAHI